MSVLERAWYYITRKKKKSMIMFLLLFCIATALVGGISVRQTVSAMQKKIQKSVRAGFTFEQEEKLAFEDAEAVRKTRGISGYQYRLTTAAKPAKGKTIPLPEQGIIMNAAETQTDTVTVNGTTGSEDDSAFVSGRFRLTEGRHLQKTDRKSVLLHETFAKANHLKAGSKIRLNPEGKSGEAGEFTIVGIYKGYNRTQPLFSSEMAENTVYADLETAQQLAGEKNLTAASYYVDNPKEVEKVKKEVEKLPLSRNDYKLTDNQKEYEGLLASTDSMGEMVQIMIYGIAGVSIAVLSLVLIFWIQSRIHETGIMLSVGISKMEIVVQYIVEILLIAVLSFGLSCFSGKAVGQFVGNEVAEQSEEAETTAQTARTGENRMDVKVSWEEMALVYASGFGIIVLSAGISSVMIIRLKPKEILSKMS